MKIKVKEFKEINELLLKKKEENKVVINTIEGLMEMDLDEFISQPVEGILYDLNRDFCTVATFTGDSKWINDFAVGLVITRLKELLNEKIKQIEVKE